MTFVPKHYNIKMIEKASFQTKEGLSIIRISEINFIEAEVKGCFLHKVDETKIELSESLRSVKTKLPMETFHQIHRSIIANMNQAKEYQKVRKILCFENGEKVNVADSEHAVVSTYFNKKNEVPVEEKPKQLIGFRFAAD